MATLPHWLRDGLWKRPLPVLSPSLKGFDSLSTYNPSVLRIGSKFLMFYRSRKPRDRHTGLIGLAESDDGVQWLKADRPVLTPGMEEDRYGCEDPRVIQWRDSFLMTYTGVSERRGETFKTHICLAFSRDGLYWRKQPITLKPTFPYYTPLF